MQTGFLLSSVLVQCRHPAIYVYGLRDEVMEFRHGVGVSVELGFVGL